MKRSVLVALMDLVNLLNLVEVRVNITPRSQIQDRFDPLQYSEMKSSAIDSESEKEPLVN